MPRSRIRNGCAWNWFWTRKPRVSGARALNYVRLQSAAGGTVVLRDEISGETCEVRPRIVVNATGAWIDFTNRGSGARVAIHRRNQGFPRGAGPPRTGRGPGTR